MSTSPPHQSPPSPSTSASLIVPSTFCTTPNISLAQGVVEDKDQIPQDNCQRTNLIKNKGFKICHVNINSVRGKFDEVKNFLLESRVDVLGLTESKLEQTRDADSMYQVVGYRMLRFDRCLNTDFVHGGGTLVYVKDSLQVDIIQCPIEIPKNSECTITKIKPNGYKTLVVVFLYNHPSTLKSKFIDFFKNLNTFLVSMGIEYVLTGDFNFDLLKRDSDCFKLFYVVKEFSLWQLISSPTFNGKSLLDHLYVSKKPNYPYYGSFCFGGSDHDLIYVVRKINKYKVPPRTISYRSYKNCNFDELRSAFETFEFKPDDVDSEFIRYNRFLANSVNQVIPLKKKIVKGRMNPWYTSDLVNLRKIRDKVKRVACKTMAETDWKIYRCERNRYNYALSRSKKLYFQNKFLESVETRSMWNTVNELTSFRVKNSEIVNKLCKPKSDETTTNADEICSILVNEFVVSNLNTAENPELDVDISEYVANNNNSERDNDICKVTLSEVEKAMKDVKKDNPSDEFVPLRVLKQCKTVVCKQLAVLFSLILLCSKVPHSFKCAVITPLYKGKGSRLLACNYRPISGLNIYCKIFERMLFNRLQTRIDSMLSANQFAYRKGKSCNDAVIKFSDYVYKALDTPRGKVIAVFIDFKKAFDSIDRGLIVKKLMNIYKLEPTYVKMFKNYLSGRTIKIKGHKKLFENPCGVSQGASIGPMLFSLFINDVETVLDLPFILYADDMIIYLSGTDIDKMLTDVTVQLEKIEKWCEENSVTINYDKTKCMVFSKVNDRSNFTMPNGITVNGHFIERVNVFSYLGVKIDSHFTFNTHYDHVLKKTVNRISYINGFKRYLSEKVFCIIINAYVHSLADYCLEIWAVQSAKMLSSIQDRIDRLLLSYYAPCYFKRAQKKSKTKHARGQFKLDISDIRQKSNMLTIDERRDLFLFKFMYSKFKAGELDHLLRYGRTRPTVSSIAHRTKIFEQSLLVRGSKLWNSLPSDWDILNMTYPMFLQKVNEYLIKKRKNCYMFF